MKQSLGFRAPDAAFGPIFLAEHVQAAERTDPMKLREHPQQEGGPNSCQDEIEDAHATISK